MGIRTAPPASHLGYQQQSEGLWDPSELLEIVNPDRGTFTCVGYAPSKGRRCQNPIAAHNRNAVYSMLDNMARFEPGSKAAAANLREIANRSLCVRYHQHQVETVVADWQRRMSTARTAKTQQKHVFNERFACNDKPPRTGDALHFKDVKEIDEYIQEALKWAQREKERLESERKERELWERKQQEQEEKMKQERERAETERKEREVREKKQQEEQREGRKRERERVEKERKQREKEQAEKDRKEWASVWDTWKKRWAEFDEKKTASGSQDPIPWPCKSGDRKDLSASTVRTFFENAPAVADSPTAMFQLMRTESLKWHPDKMARLFRGNEPNEADTMIVNMICRVIVDLRKQANEKRKG